MPVKGSAKKISVHNGRDRKNGRTQQVIVERKSGGKLPKKASKQKAAAEEKITGLFVSGKPRFDSDEETLIITLSRACSRSEQGVIKDAIRTDCQKFVRLIHFRSATIRLRLNKQSGEPLCERQVHECVIEAIQKL